MKIRDLTEAATTQKAGVIPFCVSPDGITRMMFMSPSDPHYGGPLPQIAKGGVDPGESIREAAIREGEEELGLNRANIISVQAIPAADGGTISGLKASYTMSIFAVKVKNQKDFGTPHFETGKVYWLTLEEFLTRGRKNQQSLVKAAATLIKQSST